jgi:hypothetical protein
MDEQKNKNGMDAGTCGNWCCKWKGCGSGRHFLIRWLLGLAILAIVFAVGVKIGEFKQEMRGTYGDRFGRHGFYGYRMMGGYGSGGIVPSNGLLPKGMPQQTIPSSAPNNL